VAAHDAHAQWEIRTFANTIGNEIVAKWCPLAWEAFTDYKMGSMQLSQIDVEILGLCAAGKREAAVAAAKARGWLEPSKHGGYKAHRERAELELKLAKLGVVAPWVADV
jgi:thymidylate synthase (FAD)